MNARKIAVASLVLVVVLVTFAVPVKAQETPEHVQQVSMCKTLWDLEIGGYEVICLWELLLPFMATITQQVIDPQPPPRPTPTPEPFITYIDTFGDQIRVTEDCNVNFCDYYAYILFTGISPTQCTQVVGAQLIFVGGEDSQIIKEPYFISVVPQEKLDGFIVEIRRFSNNTEWEQADNYSLFLNCAK